MSRPLGRAKRRFTLVMVFTLGLSLLHCIGLNATSASAENKASAVAMIPSLSYFHAEGRDLVSDATGERVVFRGVTLNGLEFGGFFDNPYPGVEGTNYFKPRPVDFDNVKAIGANVIRVPFEWARLVTDWNPTKALPSVLDSTYLGLLDEVVQNATQRQMYVVLDMHDFLKYWRAQSAQVCVDGNSGHQQLLAQTWKLLAVHFRDNQGVLGYDLQNEPVRKEGGEPCGSCNWPSVAQSVIDSIRSVDDKHLLIVEGQNFSLASDWPKENGLTQFATDRVSPPRIVYSPHVFFDFDNDSIYSDAELAGPAAAWPYYIRDRLMPVIDWSRDNNVPVFIGETNVPCSANWVAVLDAAFTNYFDPLHISVSAWHYIDLARCPLNVAGCSLNLAACAQHYQIDVLARHPGGVYGQAASFIRNPADSRLYDDLRVNPWDAGMGFFDDGGNPGILVDFSATGIVFEGSRSTSVTFTRSNFAGVKLIHNYGLDRRRFHELTFRIFLTGSGTQNFKIFTTGPRSDCERIANPGGFDPVYPPTFNQQPELKDYLPAAMPGQWLHVAIPLNDVVNPTALAFNSVTFQNMGSSQELFYLDDIRITSRLSGGGTHTPGLYNPTTSTFFLRNTNTTGIADLAFAYGPAGLGWIPHVGDWNGDGVDTVGLYNPATGGFFLRNTNTIGIADITFAYGPGGLGWIPLVGDWNGDGVDTVGLYNPAAGTFFLKNSNTTGIADISFAYGPAGLGWIPIVGDWNGDGIDTIGLYNPATGGFFLRNSNTTGIADVLFAYGPGGLGWIPLVGDWNADGTDTIGLYNPATGGFFLRNSNTTGIADVLFAYGPGGLGWLAKTGDWDGL